VDSQGKADFPLRTRGFSRAQYDLRKKKERTLVEKGKVIKRLLPERDKKECSEKDILPRKGKRENIKRQEC